jgi:hypothetical protein
MGIRPKWEFSPTAEFPYLYQLLNGSDLKKVAAILLLALFTFNWFGYRLFINVLEERASLSLQQKLDLDDYDNNRLVELKIPVSLPYLTNWSDFENYAGETEFNGVHYNYVKRKLVNDTLILLCIPNQEKNQLRNAQSDYFKQVNDLQSSSKKTNSKDHSVKSPYSDYIIKEFPVSIPGDDYCASHHSQYFDHVTSCFGRVAEQPPEC